MVTIYKLLPGVYEVVDGKKPLYRIYKNRWNSWTLAVFSTSARRPQFVDSRYFPTLKQAKRAVL